jgi:hypothetical protein
MMNALSPTMVHSIHSGGSPIIGQRPGRQGDLAISKFPFGAVARSDLDKGEKPLP